MVRFSPQIPSNFLVLGQKLSDFSVDAAFGPGPLSVRFSTAPTPSSVLCLFSVLLDYEKKKLIPCTLSFCFLKPLRNNSSGTHAEFSTSVTTLLNGNATSDYFFDILQCCHSPELPVAHALRYSRLPSFFPESLLILLADAHHDYNLRKFQPMAALDECWYTCTSSYQGQKGEGSMHDIFRACNMPPFALVECYCSFTFLESIRSAKFAHVN